VSIAVDTQQAQLGGDPQYCAGKLPVASDPDGKIATSFELKISDAHAGIKNTRGVEIDHAFAERTTFIVTPDGKIAATIGGLSPTENVEKTLAAVDALRAAGHAKPSAT